MRKPFLLLAVSMFLAGCVNVSPQDLIDGGERSTFDSPAAPEAVYRKVVEGSRSCFGQSMTVTADYFQSDQVGRVSVTLRGTVATSSLMVVDLEPSKGGTKISVASHRRATAIPDDVRKWLEGDYSACKFS